MPFNFLIAKTLWERNLAYNGHVPFQRQMSLPDSAWRREINVVEGCYFEGTNFWDKVQAFCTRSYAQAHQNVYIMSLVDGKWTVPLISKKVIRIYLILQISSFWSTGKYSRMHPAPALYAMQNMTRWLSHVPALTRTDKKRKYWRYPLGIEGADRAQQQSWRTALSNDSCRIACTRPQKL